VSPSSEDVKIARVASELAGAHHREIEIYVLLRRGRQLYHAMIPVNADEVRAKSDRLMVLQEKHDQAVQHVTEFRAELVNLLDELESSGVSNGA
jgi:hypothetical protein